MMALWAVRAPAELEATSAPEGGGPSASSASPMSGAEGERCMLLVARPEDGSECVWLLLLEVCLEPVFDAAPPARRPLRRAPRAVRMGEPTPRRGGLAHCAARTAPWLRSDSTGMGLVLMGCMRVMVQGELPLLLPSQVVLAVLLTPPPPLRSVPFSALIPSTVMP